MSASLQQAKDDINDAITADIVHKYVIDNAPDIISLIDLYNTCKKNHVHYEYIFGFMHTISHAMVNPRVIDELKELIRKTKGNVVTIVLNHINDNSVRRAWNTSLFHDEMKAVVSNYKEYGGFNENDIGDGIAHQIFSDIKKIFDVSAIIHEWLKDEEASEDQLINSIFNVNMAGLNKTINDYYLLHFCRGISLIRTKVMEKKTHQSILYLDMIGVKLFREKYEDLKLEDMPDLYDFCKNVVGRYTDIIFTHGDFGCLTCEMHRMISEFRKFKITDFRNKIKDVIGTQYASWIKYKRNFISNANLAPSIENSARSNVAIFLRFLEEKVD
jgi:hypothetical protein